jgi:hypothetical protein
VKTRRGKLRRVLLWLEQMRLVVPAFPADKLAKTGNIVFSLRAVKEGEPAVVEAPVEFVPGDLLLRFRGKIDPDGFAIPRVIDTGGMATAFLDPMSDSAVIGRRAEPAHETLLSHSIATSITCNARSAELFRIIQIVLKAYPVRTGVRPIVHDTIQNRAIRELSKQASMTLRDCDSRRARQGRVQRLHQ